MYIEQLYTNCLAQAAYYIESDGEAAVIDPLREGSNCIELARSRGAKIKYVFETHFHADFVSGHLELARETGAKIVFGPGAKADYDIIEARDGEEFHVGDLKFRVLHTPGHTMESVCFLLINGFGIEHAIFTGDTLFIGDVGRPDLAVLPGKSVDEMAGILYESIQSKIMPLDDDVIVYPGHGAGSPCGKSLSENTESTIGEEKRTNYALLQPDKGTFVKAVVDGLPEPPFYFANNVALNKGGYKLHDEMIGGSVEFLTIDDFTSSMEGSVILDTRDPQEFVKAHIPGSTFIGLDGKFAHWSGMLLDDKQPKLIIAEPGTEEEVVTRLARVSISGVKGFLNGGIESWNSAGRTTDSVNCISAEDYINSGKPEYLIDVREPEEYTAGHIHGAENHPLSRLKRELDELDKNRDIALYCKSGYRSVIATSVLESCGFKNVVNINEGFIGLSSIDPSAVVIEEPLEA